MNKLSEQYPIDRKDIFDTQYVFVDGISRSGKNGITPLVSSLEKVEHYLQNFNMDRTLSLLEAGHLTIEGFKYFLDLDLIVDSWFRLIGRNQNMNKNDVSSVSNSKSPEKYLSRLETSDTQESFVSVKNTIEREKLIFAYATEDLITLASEHPDVFEKIKFIIVLRHPVETIFSWHRSKRGSRLGVDQRMPHPTFNYKGSKHLPSFALSRYKEYSNETPLGKCCIAMTTVTSKYIHSLKNSKIENLVFDFDSFAINPYDGMNRIKTYLNTKETKFTETALKMARMPREANEDLFFAKASAIFANTSKSLHEEIIESSSLYESFFPDSPYRLKNVSSLDLKTYKDIDFSELTPQPAYVHGYRQN